MNKQIELLTKAIKDTAVHLISQGFTVDEVAKVIGRKFGNGVARLIMVDIALEKGLINESKKYLSIF